MSVQKRVVWITGANGGLGAAVTNAFLEHGDLVVGSSKNISASSFPSPNFVPLPADLTSAEGVRAAVSSLVSRQGSLDVLVHLLGGFAAGQSIASTTDDTWNSMRDLNLNSAFFAFREAIPHLRRSGNGRLIAIGSLAAREAHPNLGAYVVSKTALVALVQTIALENRDAGLTANVVLPGTMDTPANRKSMPGSDFSKWLPTSRVADLLLFLASERAASISGAAIPIE